MFKGLSAAGAGAVQSYYSGEKLYADMLRGEAFDLIFLDIELKAMNGVNLGDKIEPNFRTKRRTSYIFPPNRVCDGAVCSQTP